MESEWGTHWKLRSRNARALITATVAVGPLISAAAPAWAQAQNEIIVTAQKREQALIDVPAAITALGAKTVKELNLSDLSSVATQVPGFNVTSERGENARTEERHVGEEWFSTCRSGWS